MENNENLNNQLSESNVQQEKKNNNKTIEIIILVIGLLLIGFAGYKLFIEKPKPDKSNDTNKQDVKVNINYDVLNYQCKNEHCDDDDYINIKQLLKTNDTVKGMYGGKDFKNHVIELESSSGNSYLYLVDEDKYYFKDDNCYETSLIYAGYENDGKRDRTFYDYNYAVVHQKTDNKDGYNTKIYSFKKKMYVLEMDEYIDNNNAMSCGEFENQRFYKLSNMSGGKDILYDGDFNKIVDASDGFVLDDKYIFGKVEENSEYRFFRYNRVDKKFELSKKGSNEWSYSNMWTYNYYAEYNNGEYEICDFDGNFIFKTNEKTYLKEFENKKYGLPDVPYLYYSKMENKIIFMLYPDICGAPECPEHSVSSYYVYDIESKKIVHDFSPENIPDANGYITL